MNHRSGQHSETGGLFAAGGGGGMMLRPIQEDETTSADETKEPELREGDLLGAAATTAARWRLHRSNDAAAAANAAAAVAVLSVMATSSGGDDDDNSSTKAMQAGQARSIISDASAVLAASNSHAQDGSLSRQHHDKNRAPKLAIWRRAPRLTALVLGLTISVIVGIVLVAQLAEPDGNAREPERRPPPREPQPSPLLPPPPSGSPSPFFGGGGGGTEGYEPPPPGSVLSSAPATDTTTGDAMTSPGPALPGLGATTIVTVAPSPAPTMTWDSTLAADLDALLLQVTDNVTLTDPASPQYRARQWMLTRDLLRYDILYGTNTNNATAAAAASPPRIWQRYAVAVLAWAVQRPDVLAVDGGECGWYGVTCNGGGGGMVMRYNVVTGLNWSGVGTNVIVDNDANDGGGSGTGTASAGTATSNPAAAGTLPSELGVLSYLQELDLSYNGLTGTVPTNLSNNCQQLYWLDLSHNALQDVGLLPTLWAQLPLLRYVFLQDNMLAGPIMSADDLPVSPFVQHVWLDHNLLTGTFPTNQWRNFTLLESFVVDHNQLTGPLPAFNIGPRLTYLDVSVNEFNGTLPASLLNVQVLYANHNQLSGQLPDSNTTNWQVAWLHSNQLTGPLPTSWSSLSSSSTDSVAWTNNLRELTVFNNSVTGALLVPSASSSANNVTCQTAWPALTTLVADCDRVDCPCCTECFPFNATT